MSSPVTVAVTRHVDPAHEDEMSAWVDSGFRLAATFGGFLGAGWIRPSQESDAWHMLYRFDSPESLAAWEASSQRTWWLGAAQGLVEHSVVEKRTGIEGWFDEPTTRDVKDLRQPRPRPPVEADDRHLLGLLPAEPGRELGRRPDDAGLAASLGCWPASW